MSAIKDLVDLVGKLDSMRLDSRVRELILPVKEMALQVQQEQFRSERQHAEEMECLKAAHRETVARLEAEKEELRDKQLPAPGAEFDQRTGTWVVHSSAIRYCARCWTESKQSPMRDTKHGWYCHSCREQYLDPERPLPATVQGRGAGSVKYLNW